MRYTWDPKKVASNRRDHKMGLAEGIPAYEDPDAFEILDCRMKYPEERWVTYGKIPQGTVLTVVWTELEPDLIKLISVWKANRNEQKRYYLRQP